MEKSMSKVFRETVDGKNIIFFNKTERKIHTKTFEKSNTESIENFFNDNYNKTLDHHYKLIIVLSYLK